MRKKNLIIILFLNLISFAAFGNGGKFFSDKELSTVGVYYYPEYWKQSQWERDFTKMSELGFEFTHFAEFAWAQLEPHEGVYDFGWLDNAIALAAKHNLKVILCTSTATPPVWLTRKYPEILVTNEDGTKLDHGARQHASFSSPIYRKLSMEMIEQLARHYGHDNRIMGWQLDNEPAVQFDYSQAATNEFREFLEKRYHTIDMLNAVWGTSFWGQIYSNFDEIDIPKTSMKFMNPHQILDYRRFAANQTASFLDMQSECIRKYANPGQFITSNFIPNYEDGHIESCKKLDFVSYTRYMVFGEDKGIGREGFRVGEPLRISLANDFFRPIDGTYGVMELQPGQVNWGEINPQPFPGAVRLWLWNVFAGGSDFECAYRFRQPLSGIEQYHSGIVGTDGVTINPGGLEYSRFANEIKNLRNEYSPKDQKPSSYTSRLAAILFNHENSWNIERQKQNKNWDTEQHIFKYYRALKSFGAPVDIIGENSDFSKYPLLIVPCFQMVDDSLVERWKKYVTEGGNIIFTCRTGQKDRNGRFFEGKFGYKMYDLIGSEIDFYDLLPEAKPGKVLMEGNEYEWLTWGEILKPYKNTEIWGKFGNGFYAGKPTITYHKYGKGSVIYVGLDSRNGELEKDVLKRIYSLRGIPVLDLPDGVTVEYRNGFGIAMNYSDKEYEFPLAPGSRILIGKNPVSTADVLVWKENEK